MQSVITLIADEGAWLVCAVCGHEGGRMHMYSTWRVRDLSLAHAFRYSWCPTRSCGVPSAQTIRTEGHEFLAPYRRYIVRFEQEAAGLCRHMTIRTGRLEGINDKIKVIKRQAYGFRDGACFILKIECAFPGMLRPNAMSLKKPANAAPWSRELQRGWNSPKGRTASAARPCSRPAARRQRAIRRDTQREEQAVGARRQAIEPERLVVRAGRGSGRRPGIGICENMVRMPSCIYFGLPSTPTHLQRRSSSAWTLANG